jgi:hypothetical protein
MKCFCKNRISIKLFSPTIKNLLNSINSSIAYLDIKITFFDIDLAIIRPYYCNVLNVTLFGKYSASEVPVVINFC